MTTEEALRSLPEARDPAGYRVLPYDAEKQQLFRDRQAEINALPEQRVLHLKRCLYHPGHESGTLFGFEDADGNHHMVSAKSQYGTLTCADAERYYFEIWLREEHEIIDYETLDAVIADGWILD